MESAQRAAHLESAGSIHRIYSILSRTNSLWSEMAPPGLTDVVKTARAALPTSCRDWGSDSMSVASNCC